MLRIATFGTIGAAAVLAIAAPADAATEIQTSVVASALPTTATVVFNQFDPSRGHLQSVTFSIVSTLTASGSVTNTGTRRNFSVTTGTQNITNIPGFAPITITIADVVHGLGSISRNATVFFGPFTSSASATGTIDTGLAPFIGTGTLSVGYEALVRGVESVTPSSDASLNDSSFTVTQIGLTFDFVAVPELATWGMMIVGMGLAGAALRRRVQVKAVA